MSMERTRIGRNEHEKIKHKLNHQEQRDLLATPWDIWERKNDEEYVEPEYAYIEEEDVTEQEEGIIWIEGGVIDREQERQMTIYGKGSHVDGAIDMMKR
jgi:hypothetical protein